MKKIFFLDTNVILHDPRSIFKLGENEIVISSVVLEELDSKKRLQDGVGRNAREFSRILKEIRKGHEGELNTGIPLEGGGTFRVELNHKSFERISNIFPEVNNDNRIIAVALNVNKEIEDKLPDEKQKQIHQVHQDVADGKIKQKEAFDLISEIKGVDVVLITNDSLMLSKVDAIGEIRVEEYESDRLVDNYASVHAGYHEVELDKQFIDAFYANSGSLSFDEIKPFLPEKSYYLQDYFIVRDTNGSSSSFIARLRNKANQWTLTKLYNYNEKNVVWGITARNVQQKMLFDLLLDPEINLVMVTGVAGTGKTLISLASALQQTEAEHKYKKILVARPVIPMGKDIGFLPGEKEDKLRPWMQPIYDNLEYLFDIESDNDKASGKNSKSGKAGSGPKNNIDEAIANLNLEIEALTYIRGRSIPGMFIIIDEAQNLSPHEVKTIVSRAGEGTKVILLGDPEQIDHPYLDAINNGLTYAIERMKQEDDTGVISLKTTERSKLAEKAAKFL